MRHVFEAIGTLVRLGLLAGLGIALVPAIAASETIKIAPALASEGPGKQTAPAKASGPAATGTAPGSAPVLVDTEKTAGEPTVAQPPAVPARKVSGFNSAPPAPGPTTDETPDQTEAAAPQETAEGDAGQTVGEAKDPVPPAADTAASGTAGVGPIAAPPATAAAGQATEAAPAKPGRDANGRRVIRLHPLQQARPERNIIVCEAGCEGTKVVFDGARTRPASEAPATERAHAINARCEGGCYPNAPGFTNAGYVHGQVAAATPGLAPRLLDQNGGRWLTVVIPRDVPAQAVPAAAGKTSGGTSGAAKPTADATVGTKTTGGTGTAKPVKRDDWMARINRARAEERSGPPAASTPGAGSGSEPVAQAPKP